MLSAFTMVVGAIQAARLLHEALLHNKIRSPQSFFDTTPSGRILNRFSKDIYVIDEVLAPTILMLLNSFFTSISTIMVIVASTPLFMVVVLPLAVLYGFVQVSAWMGGMLEPVGQGMWWWWGQGVLGKPLVWARHFCRLGCPWIGSGTVVSP